MGRERPHHHRPLDGLTPCLGPVRPPRSAYGTGAGRQTAAGAERETECVTLPMLERITSVNAPLEDLVIRHTLRVPAPAGPAGPGGEVAARQFDAVLMQIGFKASRDLLEHLSRMSEGAAIDTAVRVLPIVRGMVGDDVRHNVYFRDFPRNVPDTLQFWANCLQEALLDPVAAGQVASYASLTGGGLNLLALPSYGRYLHTYEEMLAAHDDLIPSAKDRVTVLHLGGDPIDERDALYLQLAGSAVPLSADELGALAVLARHCVEAPQPDTIAVRENRAVINRARLEAGAPLLLDTATDVLRLAAALSDGDVTLNEPTRFRSMPRRVRRAVLAGLDQVIEKAPAKLGDVPPYREEWKRLGERLHPHEHPQWPHAAEVFAVARGDQDARTLMGRFEHQIAIGHIACAAHVLKDAPGLLFRSMDRLLRSATMPTDLTLILEAAEDAASGASARVLLSLRQHLLNREASAPGKARVFVNQLGRGAVVPDARPPLKPDEAEKVGALLDREILRRLPATGQLVIDPGVLGVALPLSGKAFPGGLGMLPRGSMSPVDAEVLRFFVHWQQAEQRTDFDLSALMLDGDFLNPHWLSYTRLSTVGGVHSGDITSAPGPEGASEFIDLDLRAINARVIIPQVNIYSGEGFEEVAESFFGFMLRDADQAGQPFEPRTVRMKSELRGPGRVALPMAFLRGDDGKWRAKWLHLHLKGAPRFNRVEGNRLTTTALVRSIAEQQVLTVRYLADLMAAKADLVHIWNGLDAPEGPVTFIGLERPEGMHPESTVFTPANLKSLIPA